jgi:hypothetical protein
MRVICPSCGQNYNLKTADAATAEELDGRTARLFQHYPSPEKYQPQEKASDPFFCHDRKRGQKPFSASGFLGRPNGRIELSIPNFPAVFVIHGA